MDIPCIQTRSITLGLWPLCICGIAFYDLQHHCFHLSSSTPVIIYFLPTFVSVWANLLVGHIISSFPQDQPSTCVMTLTQSCSSYHCGDKVLNVMEDKTMGIPRGDKVPLGDNRSATHGKLYLRHDLASPPFLTSTLILWKGYQDHHQL